MRGREGGRERKGVQRGLCARFRALGAECCVPAVSLCAVHGLRFAVCSVCAVYCVLYCVLCTLCSVRLQHVQSINASTHI